jgi:hypothetical protein
MHIDSPYHSYIISLSDDDLSMFSKEDIVEMYDCSLQDEIDKPLNQKLFNILINLQGKVSLPSYCLFCLY